jgi:hypothetical protein
VGAASIGSRGEGRLSSGNTAKCRDDVLPSRPRRVRPRSDDDEVVVHDVATLDEHALGDEFVLGRLIVHKSDVGVTPPSHVERLAGAQRDHPHLDGGLLLEDGQQMLEQTGLLGRCGGCDGDETLLATDYRAPEAQERCGQRAR